MEVKRLTMFSFFVNVTLLEFGGKKKSSVGSRKSMTATESQQLQEKTKSS